jgi:hypothetical protein
VKKGKKNVYDPYVKLSNDMTNAAAWRVLSDPAVFILIELRKSFNSTKGGNDHLVLSYRQMLWRYSRATIKKAFDDLIEWGFIRIANPGGVEGGKGNPRVFALSDVWKRKSQELVKKFGDVSYDFKEVLQKGDYPDRKRAKPETCSKGLKDHNKKRWEREKKKRVNKSRSLKINEKND